MNRTRNYASIVYPESAPGDWIEKLSGLLVPALVSPLHDRDLDSSGNLKKPHYHVMLLFSGVKTECQAREIFDQIGAVGCEKVNCVRAYARYLIHLDNPEKAQYSRDEVMALCGVDYEGLTSIPEDRYILIGEIVDYCKENDIIRFSDLVEFCRKENWLWFRVVCDNSVIVREYLKSRSWRIM